MVVKSLKYLLILLSYAMPHDLPLTWCFDHYIVVLHPVSWHQHINCPTHDYHLYGDLTPAIMLYTQKLCTPISRMFHLLLYPC